MMQNSMSKYGKKINEIIDVVNACHPGGCPPTGAVAEQVHFPEAVPMPPLPPGAPPPSD